MKRAIVDGVLSALGVVYIGLALLGAPLPPFVMALVCAALLLRLWIGMEARHA